MSKKANLSLQTKNFIKEIENAVPLYELTPEEAREVLRNLQEKYPIEISADMSNTSIFTETVGNIDITVVRPQNNSEKLPAIIYFHGGGWVMGGKDTHATLIQKLANYAHAAVIFLNYPLSPESTYPTAINQAYGLLDYVYNNPNEFNIDENKIALAGDSAGGNMAIVTALKAIKGNIPIVFNLLFYPVTDASMGYKSYKKFKNGPWLSKKAMEWFWDAYVPEKKDRENPFISPINTSGEDLKNFPPSLIITAENDILRDEGEAFARKLIEAGAKTSNVRVNNTIHDFMMLNALANTMETKSAFMLTCKMLKKAFD